MKNIAAEKTIGVGVFTYAPALFFILFIKTFS